MPTRKTAYAAGRVAALLSLCFWLFSSWMQEPARGSGISELEMGNFRNPAEFRSLTALLKADESGEIVSSLLPVMPLWHVQTSTVPDSGCSQGEDHTLLHQLDFASPVGSSTRVYRVVFESCETAPRDYAFRLVRAYYTTNELIPDRHAPWIRSALSLQLLRAAFSDESVNSTVELGLEDDPVEVVLGYHEDEEDPDRFRFTVRYPDRSHAPIAVYVLLYDPQSGLVSVKPE